MPEQHIIVVPEANKQKAIDLAKELNPEGYMGAFDTECVPENSDNLLSNVDHYIINWNFSDEQLYQLAQKYNDRGKSLMNKIQADIGCRIYNAKWWTWRGSLANERIKRYIEPYSD